MAFSNYLIIKYLCTYVPELSLHFQIFLFLLQLRNVIVPFSQGFHRVSFWSLVKQSVQELHTLVRVQVPYIVCFHQKRVFFHSARKVRQTISNFRRFVIEVVQMGLSDSLFIVFTISVATDESEILKR